MPRLLDDEKRVLTAMVAQLNRIESMLKDVKAVLVKPAAVSDDAAAVDAEAAAARLEFSPPPSLPSTTPPRS